jgi:CHASE2 domain-containing sensor protein
MSTIRTGIIIFVVSTMLYAANLFQFAESVIADLRFNFVQSDPPASMVVVAIDPKSIAEIGVWPWPRRMHAAVLDNLIDAGAERVAFDIDFSSASTPENDLALEQALARSGDKAILPVFKQLTREADGSHRLVTTVPLARFQKHAALASINVRPDSDGKVRSINRIAEIDGRILPTLSAALANEPVSLSAESFDVDFGIRSENIQHISFVDVLAGRMDPALVAGRKFIIGATAVELGDQLSVPLHRAMSGVMVQALAHASLVQNRALQPLPLLVTVALILALSLLVVPRFAALPWKPGLLITVTGSMAILAGALAVSATAPVKRRAIMVHRSGCVSQL